MEAFQERVFEHLKTAGVKNGARNEMAVFARVDALPDSALHAEGYYDTAEGEQKAYIHLGPQFAPVSRQAVNDAVKACRARGDAQWLLILGFAFRVRRREFAADGSAPAASASTRCACTTTCCRPA
jgi:adenine-specific DNA-methyltransferase